MKQNNAKVALVTGASRGIGTAIAERLARDGFKLIINYSENAAPAEALVRKLESAGGRAFAVKADISDPSASDIADVVSFLAGPDAAWVNGQVLRVNGGII